MHPASSVLQAELNAEKEKAKQREGRER